MRVKDYELRLILPDCDFSSEKVNAIVTLPQDISEVFPYLNRLFRGLHYIHDKKVLTINICNRLVTLRPKEIAIPKLSDEKEAKELAEEIIRIINETYENRDKIEPDYTTPKELKSSDITKLLPNTNCKECGERTCFAFAYKLLRRETTIRRCQPLFSGKYEDKRIAVIDLLTSYGYEV